MGINLGQTPTKAVYFGQTAVKSVFFGSQQVWGGEQPAPTAEPLCFTRIGSFNTYVRLDKSGSPDPISLEYSTDGSTWSDYTWNGNTGLQVTLSNVGDKVYFRAKNENQTISNSSSNNYKFTCAGWSNNVSITGNIQTLLKADGTRTDAPAYCYYRIFNGRDEWVPNIELPATTLGEYCYNGMFTGITGLTTAPALPATTLASNCYTGMFNGCTSLTTAPALPATTLADFCYYSMFKNCTSLTAAPALPATTLAERCYDNMFSGCSGLTAAPELPATTLAYGCYWSMFQGCTSLTAAPELPATTLAGNCYYSMFNGCSNLASMDVSFTVWDPTNATTNWLQNVAATGTFTCPAQLPDVRGASNIPEGWTVVKPAAPDWLCITAEQAGAVMRLDKNGTPDAISLETSTDGTTWNDYGWTGGTGDTVTLANIGDKVYFRAKNENQTFGTSYSNYYRFVSPWPQKSVSISGNVQTLLTKDGSRTDVPQYGFYRLFSSLQVVSAIDLQLPATTLASNCYADMFYNRSSLTTAPALPATTLASNCYADMFYNCSSLTTAPVLPATALAEKCYQDMFWGCSSLTTAPALPVTTLAYSCYNSMFRSCTSLTAAPALPATTIAALCYNSMFYGCTSLTAAPALPATTLAQFCYQSMFQGCTSLTTVPSLPATTLVYTCYANMFNGCTSLSSVEVAFTAWTSGATDGWLTNVAASGTFTCPAALPDVRGSNNIPTGWTKTDAA